jgi:hypothetical protein
MGAGKAEFQSTIAAPPTPATSTSLLPAMPNEPDDWTENLMRIATLIAAAALSIAAMLTAAATAHADSVTASVCRAGGGVVHLKPHFPHVCVGGSYDGAEVWSR